MDILLIGSDNELMREMMNKLNKEGHHAHVLTGSKNSTGSYRNAYEQYRFPYDSDSLKEIFASVRPAVTIFFGAYDSNFHWEDPRKESVQFLAALQNALTSFSMLKNGRFIYLSSEEVYAQSFANNISEKELPSAVSFRSIALSQGEDICMNYHNMMGRDTVILRLDHLYAMPSRKKQGEERFAHNIVAKMSIEAMKSGRIQANANKIFSMLYVNDAVEFIYQVINTVKPQEILYHVSSCEVTNELQLARSIQKEMGGEVEVVDNTVGEPLRVVLSNRLFEQEYGLKIFNHTEEMTVKIARYVKQHSRDFVQHEDVNSSEEHKLRQGLRRIGQAAIPFLENLIFFIPFFMLNNRAVDSRYFANLDFYLLYVLLFAIVYGQQQATLSAVLATAGYCFRQMYHRTGLEVLLDYNTYVWIAQLFILGLVVGYMRDQIQAVRNENKDEMNYLSGQLDDISDINTSNVRIKNMLEEQIINQNDSFGKIYEITSSLDQYEPEEVLFYAAEVLSKLIGSQDVAIYTVANRSYARLFSYTSLTAKGMGNSIEYTSLGEMYEAIKDKKVYINRSMDERYPLMADAIFAEEEMQLILMVWGIPWERMTLSQANMLVIIGYLIQNAVIRANRFMEALENQRYLEGTKILGEEAFTSLVRAYLTARNKGLTECTIIKIDVKGESPEEAGESLVKLMRQSDYMGKMKDGGLYALLSNTGEADAYFVIKRFENTGYRSHIQEDISV